MSKEKEEKLFDIYSESWERNMPITLITYEDGSFDLHCQTGSHHEEAIERAIVILKDRGLKIDDIEELHVYGSGAYYSVSRISI